MTKIAPRVITVLAALAAATTLAACGEKSETTTAGPPEQFKLALDWFPNPDHAPIYTALEKGEFRAVGLDVKPVVPSDPAAPLKQVAAGKVDLAISYEPEVLLARRQGLKVVSVAALVQRPLTSIISLGSVNIRKPAQLEGKRVGTAGIPYQTAYLKTILKQASVNPDSVKETSVGENLIGALLSGKVSAILGGFWNVEGVELRQKHKDPSIIPVDEAGVPDYDELVLVANESRLREDPDPIRLFIGALSRGAWQARDNPDLADRAILKANHDLDAKFVRASVRATLPAFFPERGGRPFGYQDPLAWQRYGAWMAANGLLKQRPDVSKALTNQYLPGAGIK